MSRFSRCARPKEQLTTYKLRQYAGSQGMQLVETFGAAPTFTSIYTLTQGETTLLVTSDRRQVYARIFPRSI